MSNSSLVLAGMVCLVVLWWITARHLTRRPDPSAASTIDLARDILDSQEETIRLSMEMMGKALEVVGRFGEERDADPTPAHGIQRPQMPEGLDDAWDPTDALLPDLDPLLGWSPGVGKAEGDAPDLPTGHWTGLPLPVPMSSFTQTTHHDETVRDFNNER